VNDRLQQIGREIEARIKKIDKVGDHVDSIDCLLAEAEELCGSPEAFEDFKQKDGFWADTGPSEFNQTM
jgi:hypothetical protein